MFVVSFLIGSNPSRLYFRLHEDGENQTEGRVDALAKDDTNENAAADATQTNDSLQGISGDVGMAVDTRSSVLAVDESVPVQV